MTGSIDTAAAAAFKTTDVKICFIPTSLTGGTFDTDGTPNTTATANITFDHMGVLADYLAGDIHCPPYEGDDFICLSTRKTLRGLKNYTLKHSTIMNCILCLTELTYIQSLLKM